jgi:hypothetical protein
MGRALKPTRRLPPGKVKVGDVVLVKSKAGSLRWMLVDYVVGFGRPHVWSGRWAFGGQWTIFVAHHDTDRYTVKHRDDAERDSVRLELARRAQV